jgi:hypothetical protein
LAEVADFFEWVAPYSTCSWIEKKEVWHRYSSELRFVDRADGE